MYNFSPDKSIDEKRKKKTHAQFACARFPSDRRTEEVPHLYTYIYLFIHLEARKREIAAAAGKDVLMFSRTCAQPLFFCFLHTIPVCDRFVPVHFGFEEKPAETRDTENRAYSKCDETEDARKKISRQNRFARELFDILIRNKLKNSKLPLRRTYSGSKLKDIH